MYIYICIYIHELFRNTNIYLELYRIYTHKYIYIYIYTHIIYIYIYTYIHELFRNAKRD